MCKTHNWILQNLDDSDVLKIKNTSYATQPLDGKIGYICEL